MMQQFYIIIALYLCVMFESLAHRFIILEAFGVKERIFNRAWHISFSAMWLIIWIIFSLIGFWKVALLHTVFRLTIFQWILNITLKEHSQSKDRVTSAFVNRPIWHLSDRGMDGFFKKRLGEKVTFYLKISVLITTTILYFIL